MKHADANGMVTAGIRDLPRCRDVDDWIAALTKLKSEGFVSVTLDIVTAGGEHYIRALGRRPATAAELAEQDPCGGRP